MLRQLLATARPLLQRQNIFQPHSTLAVQTSQSFHSSACAQGLEEFFETPLQEGDKPRTGRVVIFFVVLVMMHQALLA